MGAWVFEIVWRGDDTRLYKVWVPKGLVNEGLTLSSAG